MMRTAPRTAIVLTTFTAALMMGTGVAQAAPPANVDAPAVSVPATAMAEPHSDAWAGTAPHNDPWD